MSSNSEDIKIYKERVRQEIVKNNDNVHYIEYLQRQLKNIDGHGACLSNQPYVDAINKVLDENAKLPDNERISAISISWGFDESASGYKELQQAIQRAKADFMQGGAKAKSRSSEGI